MTDTNNIYAAGSSDLTITNAGTVSTLSAPNGTVNIGSNDAGTLTAGTLTAGTLTAGTLTAGPAEGGLTVDGDSGYLGIGITPEYPLHIVQGKETVYNTGGWGIGTNSSSYISSWASNSVAIKCDSGGIWCSGGNKSWILISSDSRIKTDISLVDDSSALDKVNMIESYEYNYIDPLKRQPNKTIGFLAQEVRQVLPNAVSIQKESIPDEMRPIENPQWIESGDKWNLSIDMDISSNNTGKCRFYVSDDISGNDEIMVDVSVNEDKTFTFDKKWNKVFLYGKEVDDFHTLDKNQIFALHHSAIQELSRKHDAVVQENVSLKERLAAIEAKLGM